MFALSLLLFGACTSSSLDADKTDTSAEDTSADTGSTDSGTDTGDPSAWDPDLTSPNIEALTPERMGIVACVVDGDTVKIGVCSSSGESVRFLGVDAPEIAHDGDPADCYGPTSGDWLRHALEGQIVGLTFDTDPQDDYGRTLAYVWYDLGDGTWMLMNAETVRMGNALLYRYFDDIARFDQIEASEDEAHAAGRGIWTSCP